MRSTTRQFSARSRLRSCEGLSAKSTTSSAGAWAALLIPEFLELAAADQRNADRAGAIVR